MQTLRTFLEMIKFSHTVFALPFAFMGAFLAARGAPSLAATGWILAAMAGARTAAMGFNRLVDRGIDAENPRTNDRPLPAGKLTVGTTRLLVAAAAALFFLACWRLNPLALALSPLVLALAFLYSYTKRFTWASHAVLGLVLAISPWGGWIAVSGEIAGYPYWLSLAVLLWVAGFDIVYSCQDLEYDRRAGLHSLPVWLGPHRAFLVARLAHAAAFAGFVATGVVAGLGTPYFVGVAVAAVALVAQHRLVSPDDLANIQMSFFTMNGLVSVALFLATAVAVLLPAG